MSAFTYFPCLVVFLSCMNHYPNIFGTLKWGNLRRVNERAIYKKEGRVYEKQQETVQRPRLSNHEGSLEGASRGNDNY